MAGEYLGPQPEGYNNSEFGQWLDKSTQRKIDCDYDDIGYESGPPMPTGEEPEGAETYDAHEMARLSAFGNIVTTANRIEDQLNNGQLLSWHHVPEGSKPDVKNKIFNMDRRLVFIMRMTAFNMYAGTSRLDQKGNLHPVPGFISSPKMKEAADQILHGVRADRANAREFEMSELNHMWNVK